MNWDVVIAIIFTVVACILSAALGIMYWIKFGFGLVVVLAFALIIYMVIMSMKFIGTIKSINSAMNSDLDDETKRQFIDSIQRSRK